MNLGVVAVTGATGFVGERVVRQLRQRGIAVRCLARRPHALPAGLDVRMWSAEERTDPAMLEGVAVLVHAAAYIPANPNDPSEAPRSLNTNALGTLSLLNAAGAAGVRRVVHLSTGNLYRPVEHHAAVSEDAPIYPAGHATYYLASKAVAETWATHFGGTQGRSVAVLRPSAIYGPGMRTGVVRTFIDRLRAGRKINVADGGRFRSDLVYVDDVVQAVIAALGATVEGALNVGSGVTTSVSELARRVARIVGAPLGAVEVAPATGPVPRFAALDITRAQDALGYRPRGIQAGLEATITAERTSD